MASPTFMYRYCSRYGGRAIVAIILVYLLVQTVLLRRQNDVLADRGNVSTAIVLKERTEEKIPSTTEQSNLPLLFYNHNAFFTSRFHPLVLGTQRLSRGTITIGIPTTNRPNTDEVYLYNTLDSLINHTSEEDRNEITVVVLLSDSNATFVDEVYLRLSDDYDEYIQHGFMQVIKPSQCIYPNLDSVKPSFNDSDDRLVWRAKQNVDYAFLMLYSRNISEYYLQIEDDVIIASNFVHDMKEFISQRTSSWFVLEFSHLGFIGKLFRSADIESAALYFLKNYDVQPVDLLLGKLRAKRGQPKAIHSTKSLFQHIGRFSSLKNKLMPILDKTFKEKGIVDVQLIVGDNPPGFINTSIITHDSYVPSYAYDNNGTTFFWGVTPKKSDHFTLIFYEPQNISRILIVSGAKGTRNDSFQTSDLLYSVTTNHTDETECGSTFMKLTSLIEGDVDTLATGNEIPPNIKCLQIKAVKKLKHWVIIREVRIYL